LPNSTQRVAQAEEAAATNYARARSDARRDLRARIHAQVLHPIDTPRLLRDPLYHPSSPIDSTISILKLILAAAAIHGFIILVFWVVNDVMGEREGYKPSERLVVNIVEKTPEPKIEEPEEDGPVAPDFEPKELPKPEPKPEPKKVEEPKKKPKERKKPKEVKEPEVEPGPITPDPEPQARRRIGASFESTVEGGKGPAVSTGTSRMGKTSTTAVDPKIAAKKTAGTSSKSKGSGGGGTREQRTASFIPTQKSVFVKPKRVKPSEPPYPSTLKAQGLEGNVQVRVALDAKGKVTKVTILKSSGQTAFDKAAEKAAYAENFAPATKNGKGVPFTLSYSYRFRIEEK
jgi:TonB family protein